MSHVRSFVAVLAAAPFLFLTSAGVAAAQGAPPPVGERPVPAAPPAPAAAAAPDVRAVQAELERLRAEFEAVRRQYDERLLALEDRLRQLGGGPMTLTAPPAVAAASEPDTAPAAAPGTAAVSAPASAMAPPPQAATQSSKVFNPDTSVIGNFIAAAGKNPNSDAPSLSLAEAEIAFQAIVDPYARADFYLGASEEGLDIEEGYITFTTLPANLLLKVGKMKAQFGKANTLHTHQLPYVDTPLVMENLLGGEEGLADSGFSVSHLIQNPYLFLDVTGEVYRGNTDVFLSPERSELTYVGRLRAYRDLTEATNLDMGVSFATGPTDVSPADFGDPSSAAVLHKQLYGVDATFRYRPLRRAIYQRLNLRTELIWSRQTLPFGREAAAFGLYGLGEYQMARRWYIGARFDRSGHALDPDLVDTGGSVFLTFWPTEFSQVRGQYRRTHYGDGIRANEFFLQFNFAIGAHGAHVF